ncbi:MAG: hypothetical protein OEW67_05655 [Cyclobacteriaceae bacterium]|nr:hypothetical protein [Cyclobacteriaceae bacterium]
MKKKKMLLAASLMLTVSAALFSCGADEILSVCTTCTDLASGYVADEYCSTPAAVNLYKDGLGSGWSCN